MAELGFEPEPLGSPRDSPPTPWFVPSLLFTSLPPSSAQASGHGVGQGRNQPPGACSLLWGQTQTRLAPTEADTKGWSAQRMAVQGPRPLGLRPGWDPNSQLLQSQGILLAPPLHSSLGVPGTPSLPTRPALQVKRGCVAWGGSTPGNGGPDVGEVRLPGEVHRQGSAAELQTALQAAPLTLSPSAATTSPRHSLTVTWPSFCWVGVD